VLSNPQVAVEEMLVLVLGPEQGLVCELVELFVSVVGTGSVWVLVLLPLRVVMAQPAGGHRLRMQDDPGWDQRAPRLERLAAVVSR
jgi:hypothetical protein